MHTLSYVGEESVCDLPAGQSARHRVTWGEIDQSGDPQRHEFHWLGIKSG